MIDFIPIEIYTGVFYNIMLILCLAVLLGSDAPLESESNLRAKKFLGTVVLMFCLLYMGLRPINGKYFGDMRVYANTFARYAEGDAVVLEKDVYFHHFMKWASTVMSVEMFFFVCIGLYTIPLYVFTRRVFKDYWFYGFFALILSFSFWSFGVNGVRNGIATSMFLMAISFQRVAYIAIGMLLAVAAHRSSLIILAAWLVTYKLRNPKLALAGWVLAIPMSLVLGGFWEAFFLQFGFGEDERLSSYLGGESEDTFQQTEAGSGFRWDFILYSSFGVFAGWFFIIKKKFEDNLYLRMYILYLITNSFWILVIRANFSNRFAYLSWFILGALIIYPLLKMKFFEKQHIIVARILFGYFMITYILNFVLPRI
jgi:hypothetical protein